MTQLTCLPICYVRHLAPLVNLFTRESVLFLCFLRLQPIRERGSRDGVYDRDDPVARPALSTDVTTRMIVLFDGPLNLMDGGAPALSDRDSRPAGRRYVFHLRAGSAFHGRSVRRRRQALLLRGDPNARRPGLPLLADRSGRFADGRDESAASGPWGYGRRVHVEPSLARLPSSGDARASVRPSSAADLASGRSARAVALSLQHDDYCGAATELLGGARE